MNVSSIHIDKILSLFPKWESKDLEFNKLNGLTNHTFKVTNIKYNNCLFLRIYTKLTPNINMNILQKCSDNGFGSKIYYLIRRAYRVLDRWKGISSRRFK